jgi:adenine-specific DNA-methyltransferase
MKLRQQRTNKRDGATQERARDLRRRLTPAEQILWKELRGRRFAGFKFRRQYAFGPFILDFCCVEVALVVELDGESHVGRTLVDGERQAKLEASGFRVLRFYNHDVYEDKDTVREAIYRECMTRRAALQPPHPPPLCPKGERGAVEA